MLARRQSRATVPPAQHISKIKGIIPNEPQCSLTPKVHLDLRRRPLRARRPASDRWDSRISDGTFGVSLMIEYTFAL